MYMYVNREHHMILKQFFVDFSLSLFLPSYCFLSQ